jgi:hypothetical protein
MWHVFYSHAWADKAFVKEIKMLLYVMRRTYQIKGATTRRARRESPLPPLPLPRPKNDRDAAGISGWMDENQMEGGEAFFGKIVEGIDGSDVVLLFLSPTYVTRENCKKEVAVAASYGKRLLPILLPGTPWPLRPSHGAFAGEIFGHVADKLYISAGAEGGALAGKVVSALQKMGVRGGGAGGGGVGALAAGVAAMRVGEDGGGGGGGGGWACPACTFEIGVGAAACGVCGHGSGEGRPGAPGGGSGDGGCGGGGGWACSSCTLVNGVGAAACSACGCGSGEERPAAPGCGSGGGGGGGAVRSLPAARALNGHCVAKLAHKGAKDALAVLEGGTLVSGGDSFVCAWAPGADRGLKSVAGNARKIAALPGGRFATAGGDTNLVELWDAGTGQRLHQLRGHTDHVSCVAALTGGLLASGSWDKTVCLWNAATGALVATLASEGQAVLALAALPDGRLASGSSDKAIRLWNAATRACTQVLRPPNSVLALAVLDGGRLASGCGDSRVYVWSLAGGVQEAVLEGHDAAVYSLAALPTGLLASGSRDKTVRVWDVGARACVAVLKGHGGDVRALAALPDGRLASGASTDHVIRVWALAAPSSPEDAAARAAAARCAEVAAGP